MAKQKQKKAAKAETRVQKYIVPKKGRMSVDIPFLILVFILLAFGLVMMFSSSYVAAIKETGDMYYYFNNQLRNAIIGVVLMFIAMFFKLSWVKRLTPFVMAVNILLLIAVLVIGTIGGGAKRWIVIGSFNFQPSEITKIAVVMYMSYYASKNLAKLRDPVSPWKSRLARAVIPKPAILVPFFVLIMNAGLVALEKHVSGTLIVLTIGLILLFVSGVPFSWFLKIGAVVAVGVAGLITFGHDYVKLRIDSWLNPFADMTGSSWQTAQSLYAIGSGGLLGVGLGNSVQKHLYLPEPHNDFIFAIVCEELGVVGAILVIILFGLLIWRGFTIALHSNDVFERMLVIGIISIVSIQFMLNIAVVTNLIPVTGISLPFFSYGGSALVILLVEMGLVLNVSRYAVKRQKV